MDEISQIVHVTLINDATGEVIGTTKLPPADLPESFEKETSLQMGEDEWYVVHAEPMTKLEYTKSGTLTLRLRKIETVPTDSVRFSQLDITERFEDNRSLGKDDWIPTTPLNARVKNPESAGIPLPGADTEEVYRVASKLSALRESFPVPDDGVYCPICHIANVDLGKLGTPCPKCERGLLKFGWD